MEFEQKLAVGKAGEKLVHAFLLRDNGYGIISNTGPDLETYKRGHRIANEKGEPALPDFTLRRNERAFTPEQCRQFPQYKEIEVKTKATFHFFELGDEMRTGMDLKAWNGYQLFHISYPGEFWFYFVHVFPLASLRDTIMLDPRPVNGIYRCTLDTLRRTLRKGVGISLDSMVYWPIRIFELVIPMGKLVEAPDTNSIALDVKDLARTNNFLKFEKFSHERTNQPRQ